MRYSKLRLFINAFSHFAVDMCCFFALYSYALESDAPALWVLLYNSLAFGLQAPFGAITDRLDDARPVAVLGCGLVAVGVMAGNVPLACILMIGIGNALFHVGGAVLTLRSRPGNAMAAGFFVAPGALGTAAGAALSASDSASPTVFILLMLICVLSIYAVGPGGARNTYEAHTPNEPIILGAGAVMLCLFSIGVRSFAGFSASTMGLLWWGAFSAFLGKALGGVFARKLKWNTLSLLFVGIGGLLMAFFGATPVVYIGLFLFNAAMPLTLCAVMKSLPGHEGFAFGLTTLALLLGWLPLISLETGWTAPAWLMALLTLSAALVLFIALKPSLPMHTPPDDLQEQDTAATNITKEAPDNDAIT